MKQKRKAPYGGFLLISCRGRRKWKVRRGNHPQWRKCMKIRWWETNSTTTKPYFAKKTTTVKGKIKRWDISLEMVKVWRFEDRWDLNDPLQDNNLRPLSLFSHMFTTILDRSRKVRKGERGSYLKKLTHHFTADTKHRKRHIASFHIIKLGAEWGKYLDSNDKGAWNEVPKCHKLLGVMRHNLRHDTLSRREGMHP